MLRSEIQRKTGLTRKAIEYYEEKGLIKPFKSENGYRNYSEKDLEFLTKVAIFRRIGMSISEIEECLNTGVNSLSSILRKKQHQLNIEEKRKSVLELIIKGENQELINEELGLIESEESIYTILTRAFPGYFGQMIFSAYEPFLNEPLEKEGKDAYYEYIEYLDSLPIFDLSKDEQEYIEQLSHPFDLDDLREITKSKINAVNDVEQWFKDSKEFIEQYEVFKNSDEYKSSPICKIQHKLKNFMMDNKYYEIAIPLIRKFSMSYDEYYKKLLTANDRYMELRDK